STLLNQLIGQKVAITSSVVQTTRHRIRGVLTSDKGQLVFIDTPGFTKPKDQLGEYLVQEGMATLDDADAFMVVVDMSQPAGKGDQWILDQLIPKKKPILLV